MIYGDKLIRESALEEAVTYSAAGAQVFVLYFDMATKIDFADIAQESCCGVAHAADLLYTFNFIESYFADSMKVWEVEASNFMAKQLDSIINTGIIFYYLDIHS